jgi:Tfp pilus assembly protein PilF
MAQWRIAPRGSGSIPKTPRATTTGGNVYLAKGDPDRALADINAAIRLDPKNAEFHDNLALAYVAKGDYERAMAEYDEGDQARSQGSPILRRPRP